MQVRKSTVFLLALLGPAYGTRADEPSQLVPANAAIYVEVAGVNRVIDRLLSPDLTAFVESIDQYRELTESPGFAQFKSVVAHLEGQLGMNWRQAVADLTHGGAALAFVQGSPDAAVVVLRAKNAALLTRLNAILLDLTEQDAKNNGRESPVKSADYRGTKCWAIDKGWFHTIIDDTFVFASHQNALRGILDTRAGEGMRPIAGSSSYKQSRERMGGSPVAWGYVKLDPFRDAGMAKELYAEKAENGGISFIFGGLSQVLRTAPFLGFGAWVDNDRLAVRFELPRDGASWPDSYRAFYPADATKQAAAPLHPPRTVASFSVYRDLKAFWDEKDKLIVADGLNGFTEIESQLGQILFRGRDLSSEVLSEFAPQTRIVVAAQDFAASAVVPDIKLPAFALVQELRNPDEIGKDLLIAYQTFTGLANLGLAQQSQPGMLTKTEEYKGVTITASQFLPPAKPKAAAAKNATSGNPLVYNFSPATAQVGRYFVLGSTIQIVRDLIDQLNGGRESPALTTDNVLIEIDAAGVADLLQQNRDPLIHQNMASEGHTREQAEREIDTLLQLARLFGPMRATWTVEPTAMRIGIELRFAATAAGSATKAKK